MVKQTPFISEKFANALIGQFKEESDVLSAIRSDLRKGHREDPDPSELARFKEWKLALDRYLYEGMSEGWLEQTDTDAVTYFEPVGAWVWDETEEEHLKRINPEGREYITFQVKAND